MLWGLADPAYIGLGANLGEPRAQLDWALARLGELEFVATVRASPFYATSPQGVEDQPWFVNAVAEVTFATEPEVYALLDALLGIESRAGRDRKREARQGPRILDLDLLVWGARRLDDERLTLPHPRLVGRAFVLAPLADLVGLDFSLGDGRLGDFLAAVLGNPAQRVTKLV